jgi:hypothetical protein
MTFYGRLGARSIGLYCHVGAVDTSERVNKCNI